MSKAIIVEGVSKRYTLHHNTNATNGILTTIKNQFQNKKLDAPKEEFWALKDISFEIEQGERIAIIGSNGAGKSTLLKIISRITSPSEGSIRIRGRLSSLLEVGTGFHPELTGRENVFLNGAILGMSRAEIRKKFDAIVDFAEVDKFLDTPVKHYSSGMYVRLAFAVSVFLEPDIVVLDEVLSVGDSKFQKKSYSKIKELASQGRTVIFVSHSINSVRSLCSKALLLESGRLKGYGPIDDIVEMYDAPPKPQIGFGRIDLEHWNLREGKPNGATIIWGEIASPAEKNEIQIGDSVNFTFGVRFDSKVLGTTIKMSLVLRSHEGLPIANMVSDDANFIVGDTNETECISITLDRIMLYPSTYSIGFWVGDKDSATYDYVLDCITFQIVPGGAVVTRHLPLGAGIVHLIPTWNRRGNL